MNSRIVTGTIAGGLIIAIIDAEIRHGAPPHLEASIFLAEPLAESAYHATLALGGTSTVQLRADGSSHIIKG
jgi:hypothetical protein